MRYRFLLGCLILSGFAGLAYELLWVRLLALSFGSTAASFSTVLAVFFGGLAVGSLVGGRLAKRVGKPVRAYALLELATGVAGIALYPVLIGLESTFGQIDPGPGTLGTVVRFLVAAVILLIPTVFMGATLPFVTRAMVSRDEDVGRATAYIYAFNTLGACSGAYITTFWTLPYLGVFASTVLTAGINIAVFVLASFLGRSEEALDTTSSVTTGHTDGEDDDSKLKVVGTSLAAILGFAAVALQVVWVRVFATAMEGTVYGTGSVLIAVLVGIGLGSLVLAPFLRRSRWAGLAFVVLQVVGLGLVLLQFRLLPWISYELGALQVQRLSTVGLHLQMTLVILAVLGPSVCSGASLPLIIGIVEARAARSARTVGNVYAANTVGAIFGSLVTGFVVLPSAGSEAAVLLAVVSLGGAAAYGALFLVDAPRPVRLALVPLGLLLVALYQGYDVQALAIRPGRGSFADWYKRAESAKLSTLVFTEGKSSNVRVMRQRGSRYLTLNALGQGGRSEAPPHLVEESLLMAVVPLAHAPKKEKALLVGLGAGVTVKAMLALGVGHIRVVELEPKVVDAVKVIFVDDSPLDSDRVDVVINDARHFLNVQRSTGGEKYDVIASMPAHPWVASPIFTREFFEIVKANLEEDGVFCSWFGLGKMDNRATDSLLRAFTSVFDHYAVYFFAAHSAYYLVGSPSPLEVSEARFQRIVEHPIVSAHERMTTPMYLSRNLVASGRGRDNAPVLKSGPVNTDDHPIVEMLSPTTTPTIGTASADLFSPRGLDPEMIPASERPTFIMTLLEALLGTPEGRLPSRAGRVDRKKAKIFFERARSFIDPAAARYFETRLKIAKDPSAVGLQAEIAGLAAPYRARAERARAWHLPRDTPARALALATLPPQTDVLLHQIDESGRKALARVPSERPDPDADPLGWWLWRLAHRPRLEAAALDRLSKVVGPKLAVSGNAALLTITASVARASGATHVAQAADAWAAKAKQSQWRYHLNKGIAAGKRRQYTAAADHLWRAFGLKPLAPGLRVSLVRSLLATKATDRLRQVERAFRFQGMSRAQIQHVFNEARRQQTASTAANASASGTL